ncbi:protein shisa-5-like [Acanthaster planci]|uniref:Protein shisa-5-like n=1 Tax=Acanthaster planci TaxID=133434 RepID=A0A8B7XVI7_ACAPL|nr:protein shisa-5-like [Acanthaster planci]
MLAFWETQSHLVKSIMAGHKLAHRFLVVCFVLLVLSNGAVADLEDYFYNAIDEFEKPYYDHAVKLTTGVIIGIGVGGFAFVVLVIVLCACCCYHCCCKSRPPATNTVVVTGTQPQQQPVMIMQQPVAYDHSSVPPYPGQQASYNYAKM